MLEHSRLVTCNFKISSKLIHRCIEFDGGAFFDAVIMSCLAMGDNKLTVFSVDLR